MPGVTTRNPRVNLGLSGCLTAFTVCHAISMAMTVVLPDPVAIFSARRESPGLALSFACRRRRRMLRTGLGAQVGRNLGEPYRGFGCLNLAVEGPNAAELMGAPVLQQPGGRRRHAPAVRVGGVPPAVHVATYFTDGCFQVLHVEDGLVLQAPFSDAEHFLHGGRASLLRGRRKRSDEVRGAAALDDPVRRLSVLVELPVTCRVLIGVVQDGPFEEPLDRRSLRGIPVHALGHDD